MANGGDIITRRKHRVRARRIIKKLLQKQNFRITKKIKFGTRYFIAQGVQDGKKALFKSCIYPPSYDHLTNEKFSREVLFLNFIQTSNYKQLKKAAPHIFASDTAVRTWYIREFISGAVQNVSGGNVRFKNSFFTAKTLQWILDTFFELHSIQNRSLPSDFKKLLYAPQTLTYLWRFIGPQMDKIESYCNWKGCGKLIKAAFNRYEPLYRNASRVIAHQEPYAPHILNVNGQFKLIDWENIGWASITKDFSTIWMRSSQHPAWQRQLYKHLKQHYRSYSQFNRLWTITILLQSIFNVIGYFFYPTKRDFITLARFSREKTIEILTNKFKLYN